MSQNIDCALVLFLTANTWFPFMLFNHWQQLHAHIAASTDFVWFSCVFFSFFRLLCFLKRTKSNEVNRKRKPFHWNEFTKWQTERRRRHCCCWAFMPKKKRNLKNSVEIACKIIIRKQSFFCLLMLENFNMAFFSAFYCYAFMYHPCCLPFCTCMRN